MRFGRTFLPISIFFFLIAVPIYAIGYRAFSATALGFQLHPLLKPTLVFTVLQASLSLGVSLFLGVIAGIFLSRHDSPTIRGLLFASFSLPSLAIVGLGMGFAKHTEYGLAPIVFAHAYLNTPWIALAVMEALATFPKSWREAARSLGSSRWVIFFRLYLPWSGTRVVLACAQVFAFCVMSFSIVLLLGGGPSSGTLETEIFAQVRGGGLDLAGAAQFAITQILLAGLPLILASQVRMPGTEAVDAMKGPKTDQLRKSVTASLPAVSLTALWFLFPLIPMVFNLSPKMFWGQLGGFLLNPDFRAAFKVSSLIAFGSAFMALLISLPFAVTRAPWIRSLGAVPAGVSPLVLCLGFLIAYSSGKFAWIDPFSGSVTAIILLHGVLLLPLGIRFFLPVFQDSHLLVRKNAVLAARTLGASAWVSWKRMEGPIWRRAISDFLRIAWVWSFADLAVLSFFGSENLTTIPVLISRLMSRYEFEAASSLLFLVALLSGSILIVGRGKR